MSAGEWQTALVTGGGTGIGRGIALALARRGVRVALVGRRPEPLAATAAAIQALGQPALSMVADLTDPVAWPMLIDEVHQTWGAIDTLVHNAGVLANGPLLDQSLVAIQQGVTTNLIAPIALTHLLLPDLIRQRGRLVLVGSTTSFVPMPYLALYGGTKAGLHHWGTALRHELTSVGVHLLIAYPPATATAMTAPMAAPARQPKLAQPAAIGEAIVRALAQGRRECVWWGGEHLLRLLYGFAPGLTQRLLFTQRHHFSALARGDMVNNDAAGADEAL